MSKQDVVIVTGASSGIGSEVALELADKGYQVLAVARREKLLRRLRSINPNIVPVTADLTTNKGLEAIHSRVAENDYRVRYLVHSAGSVYPVKPLVEISQEEWRKNLNLNLDATLFLTQKLLPFFDNTKVLMLSSDSAGNPRKGWSGYSVSKTALSALYETMKKELPPEQVSVGLVRPGPVETAIAKIARNTPPDVFPDQALFRQWKDDGKMINPGTVGKFITWLLTETEHRDYSETAWDIRDESHHRHWLKGELCNS
ncbi:MAG: SDR family oxidoreductase [Endozoicomonas sp.]